MSIPILDNLQVEIERLCAAGSTLAQEDFGLKKLLPGLKKMGETTAVFAKLASKVDELIVNSDNSEEKLLELLTLVNAIAYTQGTWEVKGEIKEIEAYGIGDNTIVTFRKIKPILEALTRRGAGRYSIIEEAFREGWFYSEDIRLMPAVVSALEDPYPEIAEFILENVIPQCGELILPLLKDALKLEGGKGDGRRLKAIYKLSGESERELYYKALELGSQEVKLAAIDILDKIKVEDELFEKLCSDKKTEIRAAAIVILERRKNEKKWGNPEK